MTTHPVLPPPAPRPSHVLAPRPGAFAAPPLRPFDGLAADAPVPGRRGRVLRNPFLRLGVFVLIMGAAFVAGAFVLAGLHLTRSMAAGGLVQLVAVSLAYLVLVRWIEGRRPLELDSSRSRGLVGGLALGAVLFTVAFGAILALGGARIDGVDLGYNPWLLVLTAGLVAGVSEEMVFRGVLFRLLEELTGTWGAVAASGLVFGLVHVTNPDATWWGAIAIALEAGLLFALLYVVTRSLWVLIGVHAAWNITQGAVFGVAVSGTGDPGGFIQTSPTGPDLLSGGRFGAEASVVTVTLLCLFAAWLAVVAVRRGLIVAPWWTRRRRYPAA